MLHKLSHHSHKIHAPGLLLAVFLLRLIYQQLCRSHVTDVIIYSSTVSDFLMAVEHHNQACEDTTADEKSCIQ